MLTGVDAEVDIVSMRFDAYLKKPVSREALHDTIERLLQQSTYDSKLQEYFSLASRRAALETEYEKAALENRPEFRELCSQIEAARRQLDAALDELPELDGDLVGADSSQNHLAPRL